MAILDQIALALRGGAPHPQQGAQFVNPNPSPLEAAQNDLQRLVSEFSSGVQAPKPLPLPEEVTKGQTIAAVIGDAINRLAAGRAPRGIPATDFQGLLRDRRQQREGINRLNVQQQNEFDQGQQGAQQRLEIEQARGRVATEQRKEEIQSQRDFDDAQARARAGEVADLRRELQKGQIDSNERLAQMQIDFRKSLDEMGDKQDQRERRQIVDGIKNENTARAEDLRAGKNIGTREDLLRRYKRDLDSFSILTDADKDLLLLDYMMEVDALFEPKDGDDTGGGDVRVGQHFSVQPLLEDLSSLGQFLGGGAGGAQQPRAFPSSKLTQ